MSKFFKKHGLMIGLAIVIPGGELLLLGKYLHNKYKKF
jgi:hypothetical protein